jgi:hypothetical protein
MMHLFQILIEMVCAICNRSCIIQHHLLQFVPACGQGILKGKYYCTIDLLFG